MALAILAFAVIGLLAALNTAVDAARVLRREAQVRQCLENRLTHLRLDPKKNLRREIPADESGVSYIEEIKAEQVANSDRTLLDGYQRISVVARWRNNSGQPEEREASFLALVP